LNKLLPTPAIAIGGVKNTTRTGYIPEN